MPKKPKKMLLNLGTIAHTKGILRWLDFLVCLIFTRLGCSLMRTLDWCCSESRSVTSLGWRLYLSPHMFVESHGEPHPESDLAGCLVFILFFWCSSCQQHTENQAGSVCGHAEERSGIAWWWRGEAVYFHSSFGLWRISGVHATVTWFCLYSFRKFLLKRELNIWIKYFALRKWRL